MLVISAFTILSLVSVLGWTGRKIFFQNVDRRVSAAYNTGAINGYFRESSRGTWVKYLFRQ